MLVTWNVMFGITQTHLLSGPLPGLVGGYQKLLFYVDLALQPVCPNVN